MLGKRYEYDDKPIWKLNNLQSKIKKQIVYKIGQSIYQFESIPCCICNNEEFKILSSKDRYGMHISVVICRKCGLIQTNPRMDQKSYNNFYKNEYHKLYLGKEAPSNEFFLEQYAQGKRIYTYLENVHVLPKLPSELSIFEIGCGAGGILQYFMEKGCRTQGIDIDERYIEFGKTKYGLDLSIGTIADVSFDEFPDIIIYSHALEHVLFPKEELAHIHRILSENGIVYIETPGVKNLLNSYDMDFLQFIHIAHTYHFTLTTLKNLLETNGFQMISGNETIRSVFEKSESISSSVAARNDREAVIAYLNRLERLRKWVHFPPYIIKLLLPRRAIKILKIFGLYDIVRKAYRRLICRRSKIGREDLKKI